MLISNLKSIIVVLLLTTLSNNSFAQTYVKVNGNINYGYGYTQANVNFCVNSSSNFSTAYVYCVGQVAAITNYGRYLNQKVDGYIAISGGRSGYMCGSIEVHSTGSEQITNINSDVYCQATITSQTPNSSRINRNISKRNQSDMDCFLDSRNECLDYNNIFKISDLDSIENQKIYKHCSDLAFKFCGIP